MMLETLLKILAFDLPCAAEILLEEDGDMLLSWPETDIDASINPAGGVNWAALGRGHGTDIEELQRVLENKP